MGQLTVNNKWSSKKNLKILFMLVFVLSSSALGQVPSIERAALLDLYIFTDGSNWKTNTGWNGPAGTECNWFGVTCSGGKVWSIDLQNNSLSGTIPPRLSYLTDLRHLFLPQNSLSGNIPPELGNLLNLKQLWLADNSLSGALPVELRNLTNLTYLSFSRNQLAGNIPPELGKLTKLTRLYLSSNELTGVIPNALSSLTNLTILSLSRNNLTGQIPASLGKLTKLTGLYLHSNELMGVIPAELGSLKDLTYLYLDYNSLSGSIPRELGDLTNLTILDLEANKLTGSIPSELGNLTNLIDLQLNLNGLIGTIPSEIGKLTNLTGLYLQSNQLTGTIPSELSNLTSLETLNLSNNQFSRPKPNWLSTTSIKNLYLGGAFEIPPLERQALVDLYDSTNGNNWDKNTGWLGGNGTECDWYGITCSDGVVTSISLSKNSLEGGIPASIGNLTNLTGLYLNDNSLTGSIPPEVGNLTNLTRLYLNYNSLTGSIPREVGNLTNLTRLYLYDNSLTGNIPPEVGNLTSLTLLSLRQNSLTGSIPSEIGNLTNLTGLYLYDNSLTGIIPPEIGNLTNLTRLYLYDNSLTGSIPPEIGKLWQLNQLNLSDNSLTGSIPAELGNLVWLTSLNFRNNELAGTIPSHLSKLTNLTYLSFSNNSFALPKPGWMSSSNIETLYSYNAFNRDIDSDGIDDEIDFDPTTPAKIRLVTKQPTYSISILGSGRVVNWVSKSRFEKKQIEFFSEMEAHTSTIYSYFKDSFDFMMFAFNRDSYLEEIGYAAQFFEVEQDVKGIGRTSRRNGAFGSQGKLTGAIEFIKRDGLTRSGLHEVMHNWGNEAEKSSLPISSELSSGHWGYRNIGGQLGGWLPGSLETLENGLYRAKSPNPERGYGLWGGANNDYIPYSQFELYLMGMIPPSEIGYDIKRAIDFEWADQFNGTFKASSIETLTIEEFIETEGPRQPSYVDSQKAFRGMYVVISDRPLTLEEWRTADKAVRDFEYQGDNGGRNDNFWEATNGKGTFSFGDLETFSKRDLRSFLPYDLTVSSPDNKEPNVSIDGPKRIVVFDTDNLPGEVVSVKAKASDIDGSISKTKWFIDGQVVEGIEGLAAELSLVNGSNLVKFEATDDKGASVSSTQVITVLSYKSSVQLANEAPIVQIFGGSRIVSDTDNFAGESVSLSAKAEDADGSIAGSRWLMNGNVKASGTTAKINLPNGKTTIVFEATDNLGITSETSVIITVLAPKYVGDPGWPSPYNGVTPRSSLSLSYNNIGVYDTRTGVITSCLQIFTDGLESSFDGHSRFDFNLKLYDSGLDVFQFQQFRPFNTIGALNENIELPDCSGRYESTTGLYTDVIETRYYSELFGGIVIPNQSTKTFEMTFDLIDSSKLLFRLKDSKEL